MTTKSFNRVIVATATTGAGTITLDAATAPNALDFAEAGAADGDEVNYVIEDGADFEIGVGTLGGGLTTLSRDTVHVSKAGGVAGASKLNLSGAAVVRSAVNADYLNNLISFAAQILSAPEQAQARANIGAPVGDFRNLLINPLYDHNQRVVSGTVVLAANEYGHDRWRAGAAGCTYTFSTSNGVTTINISAGSLQQVIEATAFAGRAGTYVLSWTGTAQGRIGAGAYGDTGAVSAACDGSADVTVEFGTGTVSLAQFEHGYVTEFAGRHPQTEMAFCQWYFQTFTAQLASPDDQTAVFATMRDIPNVAQNPGTWPESFITRNSIRISRPTVDLPFENNIILDAELY